MKNKVYKILSIVLVIIFGYVVYFPNGLLEVNNYYKISNIPEYTNKKYIIINNNIPEFEKKYYTKESFEEYSKLDELGRCGVAFANIGTDLMPKEKREYIGYIKPSGWQYTKYDFIDGKYLYNRCHLIAYQLTGENANPNNLITCTRSMNSKIMTEFENKVANYIKKTNNHVLYRVTPIFEKNNLIAKGIQIEAESIEDNGKGIKFNVFIYNVEDKININYLDGTSSLQ